MLLWIIATFVAFFVKGLCGFANTLVFTSILGFGVNNLNISPTELLLGYPANFILTLQNRKKLNLSIVIPLSLLVLAGSIVGAFLLKSVNAKYLKIFFGAVVIFVAIETYLRERAKKKAELSKILLAIVGLFSGLLCGLFGVGALLAAYAGRASKSSDEFKANISAVFIVENTFRIIVYLFFGVITLSSAKLALMLIPFALAGLFAGTKCSRAINEKSAKNIVIAFLIISGLSLIARNL